LPRESGCSKCFSASPKYDVVQMLSVLGIILFSWIWSTEELCVNSTMVHKGNMERALGQEQEDLEYVPSGTTVGLYLRGFPPGKQGPGAGQSSEHWLML
jgi:hypothetical protein